jgi:endonuclease/exonuclease/phosphatase (EEP) superfamily protein YafD
VSETKKVFVRKAALEAEAAAVAKTRKRPKGYLGCILGLSIGIAGLAAARLGQLWVTFDVFSQVTPQLFFLILAFTIGLFMPHGKVLTAVVLLIGLLAAYSMWPYYVSSDVSVLSTVKSGERELRVASFNTWIDNDKIEDVKAEITRIDADVIVLVELGPNKRVIFDQLRLQYPYQAKCSDITHCNFGILSKFPLTKIGDRMLWEGPPYIRASLGPEFGGLSIYGVHTTRFPHTRAQFTQIKAMAAELDAITGNYVVMGDFNATPNSRVTQTLANQGNLMLLTNLPTWPARTGLPQIAIDHIFVTRGIRQLERQRIGNSAGSDHFPITMKLAVPLPL